MNKFYVGKLKTGCLKVIIGMHHIIISEKIIRYTDRLLKNFQNENKETLMDPGHWGYKMKL